MSNDSKKKIASSPKRNTFQKERYLERQAEAGKTPDNDPDTADMLDYYLKIIDDDKEKEVDPEWRKDNLEYDLRSTDWIVEKAKSDETYAQNLYAALCNNQFQKLDVIPILKDQKWSCSWRYAGGIIADMREEGDYIDWYCSGIRNDGDDGESIDTGYIKRKYVSESAVTDEIREDLKKLGWVVVNDDYDEID
jgi:hypothetical protein